MQVGDLVRHRFSESGMLGVVVRKGHDKLFVAWTDGGVRWCVRSLLKVINASR